jgi:hypothetical protein
MRLLKARVMGFQSFADSGELEFGPGINLLVGQNNAGKSALLRGLQLDLADDRHRTPTGWLNAGLPWPYSDFVFELTGDELRMATLERNQPTIIPVSVEYPHGPIAYAEQLLGRSDLRVAIRRRARESFTATYPSHGDFVYPGYGPQIGARLYSADGTLKVEQHNNGEDLIPEVVAHLWQTRMFYFSAERLSFGRTNVNYVHRLDATASNLAAVLNTLSGDRGDIFRRLIEHLRELFPSVGNLSTRPAPDNPQMVEVRVWPTPSQERPELSFPLAQSGTGVAQVIAILTAVMTIERACIIIDEINSFLHPSAIKGLLRILQTDYSQHQYVISTHAPEVISFSNPDSIHLVKRSGYVSTVEALDAGRVESLRFVAAHLGVSMADVFAAERVIWVEGETEELVFPYLYREMVGPVPRGTVFTTVSATGDFGAKRRDRSMVYEAYARLSEAVSTMPVAVVFGFDTETLTTAEKIDMNRDSGGRLHFLPRRHLECYFLDAPALADRINARDTESNIGSSAVEAKLLELAALPRFGLAAVTADLSSEEWLAKVDAAKLLAALFSEVSEARIEYDKTSDGLALVKLMLAREPATLTPLVEYVSSLVDVVAAAA